MLRQSDKAQAAYANHRKVSPDGTPVEHEGSPLRIGVRKIFRNTSKAAARRYAGMTERRLAAVLAADAIALV